MMPIWKQIPLSLYYRGSYPVRRLNHRRAVAEGQVPVAVLFYHRIGDNRTTPWTVSNGTFAGQIGWLQKHFELISLEDVQRRIASGVNRRPCVSITFDDGYADNCHQAIPLLIKHQIPCTYFVTLQNVLDGQPFAHDAHRGDSFAPNTLEQLRAMAAAGVEIAAHTYTHADLGSIDDPGQLRYEIVSAGQDLEALIDRPVRYFAFPFGQHVNLSHAAFETARQAGYKAACSAYGGFNFPGGDTFHLQRIPVDDVTLRLKNWVTVDPRKRNTYRFVYEPSDSTGRRSRLRSGNSPQ